MNPEENKQNENPVRPVPQGDVRRHRHIDWTKVLLVILLILALAGGGAGYYWRDKQAKDDIKEKDDQIAQLRKQETQGADEGPGDEAAPAVPTQAMIDNIKAVFATGNTQPLETYMANQVSVILAASECCGNMSPAEATQQVESFMAGTSNWDFALPETTLTKYRAGFYKDNFPNNAVVGKSGNKVISFSFDNDGKISKVFMTTTESVLMEE